MANFFPAISLLFFCLFSSLSFAAQNVALTHSDASIKEFQRKVVLINPGVGHESIDAEIEYCPFKGKCKSRGSWSFALSGDLMASDARILNKGIGFGRFDALSLSGKTITIAAPYGKIELDSAGAVQGGGVMSEAAFRASFEKVLSDRAPGIAQALADAVELRAKSLRDKEAGTAMTGRMKSSGLDVATLQNMMDDGYAFASYVPATVANVTVSEAVSTDAKTGAKEISYTTTLRTNVTTHIYAYHFDANTRSFNFYKQWFSQSGPTFASGKTSKTFPKNTEVQESLATLYATAYETAVANISLQVMRDENFSVQTKITGVDSNQFNSNLHAGLDVRTDSLWTVSRSIDGAKTQLALGKARHVAPAPREGEETYSSFDKIKGDAEQGDQLSEFPSTGVKGNIGLGAIEFNLEKIGNDTLSLVSADPKHVLAGLKAGIAADLGYKLNSESLSELWISFDLAVAGGSKFKLGTMQMNAPVFISLDIGLERTLYLGSSGFSVSPGMKLAYSELNSSGTDTVSGNTYDLKLSEVTFKPGVSLDYTLDSFNEFSLGLEYPVQLSDKGTLKNTGTAVENALGKNKFGQRLAIFVMYRWNSD
ncbi:MAG: hypothetical protein PHQ60_05755 [Sideroxydans sp.]|nr:hypothetical protein [Sideroxydans sp.]